MRNSIVVNLVRHSNPLTGKVQILAHFTTLEEVRDNKQIAMEAQVGRKIMVPAPNKLQGNDFNLIFPLTATKDVQKLDFEEIENIMVVNRFAHNLTDIEKCHKTEETEFADWRLIFNELPAKA